MWKSIFRTRSLLGPSLTALPWLRQALQGHLSGSGVLWRPADEDSVLAVRVGADMLLVEVAGSGAFLLPGHAGKPRLGDSIEFTTPWIEVHPYSI